MPARQKASPRVLIGVRFNVLVGRPVTDRDASPLWSFDSGVAVEFSQQRTDGKEKIGSRLSVLKQFHVKYIYFAALVMRRWYASAVGCCSAARRGRISPSTWPHLCRVHSVP